MSSARSDADVEVYRLLCAALSDNPVLVSGVEKAFSHPSTLSAVLELARTQRILPALHAAVMKQRLTSLPTPERAILAVAYEANKRRNLALRRAIFELASAAAQRGIDVVALKGSAWLLEDAENFAAWRTMIDIDLLVSLERFDLMPELLAELGYAPTRRRRQGLGARTNRGHFHLSPYRRGGDPFTIEIHRHLGWKPAILPTAIVFETAQPIAPGLSIPAPWCAAFHAIVHWQIQHDAFHRWNVGIGDIRSALEIARFLMRNDVDWDWLATHAKKSGIEREFEMAVGIAGEWFGIILPTTVIRRSAPKYVAHWVETRSSPATNWVTLRRAQIAAMWRCDREMYRAQLRNPNPFVLRLALWSHRASRLPVLAYLCGMLALARVASALITRAPAAKGRPERL